MGDATNDGRLVASDRQLVFETSQKQSVPYSPSPESVIEQLGMGRVYVLVTSSLHSPCDLGFSFHDRIAPNVEYLSIYMPGSVQQHLNHRTRHVLMGDECVTEHNGWR